MVISAQATAASDPPPPAGFASFAANSKPVATVATPSARPWNLRSRNGSVGTDLKERRRKSFSVALTCDEIAEDIYAITGALPRRRPKKRPRVVQKYVEMVFPGSWLKEITEELYKVPHSIHECP